MLRRLIALLLVVMSLSPGAALNAYALVARKFQDQAVALAYHRLAGSL